MVSLPPQVRTARLTQEIRMLASGAAYGITCTTEKEDVFDVLKVTMCGPKDTPYSEGVFELSVTPTDKYPFEPPLVKFVTPVYHPNIDKGGRICLDMLKMPPKGAWAPTITLETLLVSIQTLLGTPNPEDPLMMDISNEFKNNREMFNVNARKYTQIHACPLPKATKRKIDEDNTEEPTNSQKEETNENDAKTDNEASELVNRAIIRNIPLFSTLNTRCLSRKRNKE